MNRFLVRLQTAGIFQTLLYVLPVVVVFGLYFFWMDSLCGAIEELVPRIRLLYVAAWCVAGFVTLLIVGLLRFFSVRIQPFPAAVIMMFLFFPLDAVGHALAEDWTLASLKASGLEAREAGSGEDWQVLYSELLGNRQGLATLGASEIFGNEIFAAVGGLPILLLTRWAVRRLRRSTRQEPQAPELRET